MTAREHNNLLGIFYFVQGGLTVLGGIFMTLMYGGIGLAMLGSAKRDEEQLVGGIFFLVGLGVGFFLLLISALYFFTGFKVRKVQPIGRIFGIILSCLSLLSIPIGTALGIYGLWFFLGDLGKNLYAGNEFGSGGAFHQAPPPNSWQ